MINISTLTIEFLFFFFVYFFFTCRVSRVLKSRLFFKERLETNLLHWWRHIPLASSVVQNFFFFSTLKSLKSTTVWMFEWDFINSRLSSLRQYLISWIVSMRDIPSSPQPSRIYVKFTQICSCPFFKRISISFLFQDPVY